MKKFEIELKWAVIFSVALLLWMYFEKAMGWHSERIKFQPIYTMLFGVIAVIIYVLALLEKKKEYYNSTIHWKQSFLSGAILSLFIAFFTPVVLYITYAIISPEFFSTFITYKTENTKMSLADAEKYFSMSNYLYANTFSTLSNGIVISAIISFFIKSKTN